MSPQTAAQTILFVDAAPPDRDLLRAAFAKRLPESALRFFAAGREALEHLQRHPVTGVFVGRTLPDMDGVDWVRAARDDGFSGPIVTMMDAADETAVLPALREGADEHALKTAAAVEGYPALLDRAMARHRFTGGSAERDRAIVQSQRQWMALFDAITDSIFVLDEEAKFVRVNHACATSVGLHPRDMIGKRYQELFGSDLGDTDALKTVRETALPVTREQNIGDQTFQISVFPLHDRGRLLTIHFMKNITELRRLKDQLYHADKLASLGLLVSGVAHEINNPLTGTIAYTELLRMTVTDERVLGELKKISDSAERCKKIVDNLLTFSRQQTPSKSVESINDIIDRAIDLRSYWLRSSNITIVRDYDPVSTVFVDSQQIQQVALNILLNAEQAITGAGMREGKITFSTKYDRENKKVVIAITNNGPAIPPAHLSRIFDPFFTTKPVGVGTGLGLSISHGIIIEHGGTVEVENRDGEGVRFTIELPTGTDSLAGAGKA